MAKVRARAAQVSRRLANPKGRVTGGPRIVYNKLLAGWYVVTGPHQTPLNGRFNSKAEAQAWLSRRGNPGGRIAAYMERPRVDPMTGEDGVLRDEWRVVKVAPDVIADLYQRRATVRGAIGLEHRYIRRGVAEPWTLFDTYPNRGAALGDIDANATAVSADLKRIQIRRSIAANEAARKLERERLSEARRDTAARQTRASNAAFERMLHSTNERHAQLAQSWNDVVATLRAMPAADKTRLAGEPDFKALHDAVVVATAVPAKAKAIAAFMKYGRAFVLGTSKGRRRPNPKRRNAREFRGLSPLGQRLTAKVEHELRTGTGRFAQTEESADRLIADPAFRKRSSAFVLSKRRLWSQFAKLATDYMRNQSTVNEALFMLYGVHARRHGDYAELDQGRARNPKAIEVPMQAFHDWMSGRAYLDNAGNYRLRPGKRVAPWNRAVKAAFGGRHSSTAFARTAAATVGRTGNTRGRKGNPKGFGYIYKKQHAPGWFVAVYEGGRLVGTGDNLKLGQTRGFILDVAQDHGITDVEIITVPNAGDFEQIRRRGQIRGYHTTNPRPAPEHQGLNSEADALRAETGLRRLGIETRGVERRGKRWHVIVREKNPPKGLTPIYGRPPIVSNASHNRDMALKAFKGGMTPAEIAKTWPRVWKLTDGKLGQRYDSYFVEDPERFETRVMITAESVRKELAARRGRTGNRRTRNPRGRFTAAELKAAETVRMFQDRGAIAVHKKRMRKPPPLSTTAAELGKLVGVVYRTDKFDGKQRDYEHDFSKPLPSLVTDPEGRGLHVVGGKFDITPDGIVN